MTARRADKRTTRLVYGPFVAFTAVFVGSLIVEVASQVFSDGPPSGALSAACARGVRDLEEAVNVAIPAGLSGADVDDAVARYRRTRDERWASRDAIAATCAGEPRGVEALAAVARMDRQAEAVVRKQTVELRAVRREVDSFIR